MLCRQFLGSLSCLLIAFLFPGNALAALDPATMAQHLQAGTPILGQFSNPRSPLTEWMGLLCDSHPIEELNVSGTHASCSWNYTGIGADRVNTQDRPIFDQLNAGIRFLDIRFGLDEFTNVLRVYHGDALLSATASLEDVLWGLYHFLDTHPSETLLVLMKDDHGDVGLPVQEAVHALITSPPVSDYWVQSTTLPANLGAARGKIVLFHHFAFDMSSKLAPVGLDVASGWADNNADFGIAYSDGEVAYIEDLYKLDGDVGQVTEAQKAEEKFQAIQTHFEYAQPPANTTQVFITFGSASGNGLGDILTPKRLAVGDKSAHLLGINQRINDYLESSRYPSRRLGIVLYNFFESPSGLIRATIGL